MPAPANALILDATAPYLSEDQLRRHAMTAKDAGVYGLCVLPGRVRQAAIMVARSVVRVRTLIGYPTGVHTPSVKALELRLALQEGANDVAVTPNLGYFLGGEDLQLSNELAYVAKALREVAPARARNLAIVLDMQHTPVAQIERLGALLQRSGGHGLHLLWPQCPSPDALRALLRAYASRLTTELVSVHAPVPDVDTAQALLDAGAHYLITPNAAALASAS
jgi:hypothetical protein